MKSTQLTVRWRVPAVASDTGMLPGVLFEIHPS
jgi:hypothetical protein